MHPHDAGPLTPHTSTYIHSSHGEGVDRQRWGREGEERGTHLALYMEALMDKSIAPCLPYPQLVDCVLPTWVPRRALQPLHTVMVARMIEHCLHPDKTTYMDRGGMRREAETDQGDGEAAHEGRREKSYSLYKE